MITLWGFWATLALLGYVYLGYPLALATLSMLSPARRRASDYSDTPLVSLIVPAFNEADVLREKLENALGLDYPREQLEVLLGNDCSDDDTLDIARRFEERGVHVLSFSQRRGKASVVNDLIDAAQGEVVMLCDANVMFAPDALRRLVGRLADSKVGAVTGDVRLKSEDCSFGWGETLYYHWERRIQLWESSVGSLMGVDGGMYVIRKDLLQTLPADTILDDFVISMRVVRQGKRVVYEPYAVADENATPRAASEFRRRVRVSAGAVQSVLRGEFPPWWRPIEFWQFLSHKLLRWLIPLWLLLLLATNAWLWNSGTLYRWSLAMQASGYLLAGLGAVFLPVRQTRVGGVVFYFTMTFLAMAVGTIKGLCFRQSGAWAKTERRVIG